MKKKYNFIFLISFQLITAGGFAQTKQIITGTLKDSLQKPVSFATAGLYRQNDPSQPLKVTYTNDKGKFSFSNIDTGSYTLIATHTGFAETRQDITVKDQNIELNDIVLLPAIAQLQGVSVKVIKPLIEQADDKVVFNVENDPTAKTENAIDILRKTPFVSVDGDNNVLVNGQSNFKVLLNGRETSMFANNVKEALRSFPGALITKIEVITSPSAKYDGEGIGGIINIITRKKVIGYNGAINLNYSNTWRNVNGNFSAKAGKFGATAHFGMNGSNNIKGSNSIETLPYTATIFTRRYLQGGQLSSNLWNWGNAELSYEIDSVNTLSFYGNMNGGWNESVTEQTRTTDFTSGSTSISYYDLVNRSEHPNKSVGADYIRKFSNNKDKEFSIRLNGEFGNANTFLKSEEDNPNGYPDRYVINNSIAKNRQYTIQSDYILPLANNQKLETGVKAILRRAFSDFTSMEKNDPAESFKVNTSNTDYFKYNQDIFSVYSSYSFKAKKVTYRLGARVEHTEVNGDFTSSSTASVKQSYTTLLPNLQATIRPGNAFTWVLNYNMRLQRPSIYSLNPFVENNDTANIVFGNPNLNAQTIHSVSVQSRVMKGSTFAGLTLTGSYSDNLIVRYTTFNAVTGTTSTTRGNFGEEIRIGLNGNVSVKFNDNWSMSVNGNVTYNRVKNKFNSSQTNSGVGGNANMNTSYKLNTRFNVSSYAGFWRAPVGIQTTQSINIWYGLGLGYKMFKEKLTVSFGASNFLKKNNDYIYTIEDPAFKTTSISTQIYRGISAGLSWNFGKLKENVSKKKGVNNDDLIGGGQGTSN